VISSKARATVQEWGDHYALIGPYNAASAAIEFEPLPPSRFVKRLIDAMAEKQGIAVHFGRWLVKGYPRVFLLDLSSGYSKLPRWRNELQVWVPLPSRPLPSDPLALFLWSVFRF